MINSPLQIINEKFKSKVTDVYESSFIIMGKSIFFLSRSALGQSQSVPPERQPVPTWEEKEGWVVAGAQGVTDTHEARHCHGYFKVRGKEQTILPPILKALGYYDLREHQSTKDPQV